MDDINFGIKNKVDFIALSFVRDKEDLQKLQHILNKKKSYAKIIAKIENQDGLDNINDICKFSWGVMVARGDLGIETSLTDLPNIQRKIMHACAKWGRRSIVATHLLESSGNIRAVQEFLGHENISTTQIYTHLDNQYLMTVYDKVHPRAKKTIKKD